VGEVVAGRFVTNQDSSPDRALEGAADYGLESVVIVGFDKDGELFFASSQADSGEVLYFLERAKWELMKMEDEILENGDPRGKPRRGA
jgi:hypothetical protein